MKKYFSKIAFRLYLIYKYIYRFFVFSSKIEKKIIFIVGNQRSGTSIMEKVFKKDKRTRVFEDISILSSQDKVNKIRLNPLRDVNITFAKVHAPLIVFKPLVESQYTPKLLKGLKSSNALWMYRGYKDSINSNLAHFGLRNGIRNLAPIVNYASHNWRSEGVPPKIREKVMEYFSQDMNPYTAAALFWFVRNQFYFSSDLYSDKRVYMCKYEYFVQEPEIMMKKIYDFIEVDFPGIEIVNEVHIKAMGKGKQVELNPEIDKMCNELENKLDEKFYKLIK